MTIAALADDITGATDLAGAWRGRGLRTLVHLGLPDSPDDLVPAGMDAAVCALKIRQAAPQEARATARRFAELAIAAGVEQVYDKYCSTFDSTAEGNIGPILDELAAALRAERAVVVPAMPANGRTVYRGHLFVHDDPLDESPMREHPLTPMRDSSVLRLLRAQTDRPVVGIGLDVVRRGPAALRSALDGAVAAGGFCLVVDATEQGDLETINAATRDDLLVTGGSGLAAGSRERGERPEAVRRCDGRRIILAGSASRATRGQIAHAGSRIPTRALDPERTLLASEAQHEELLDWVRRCWAEEPGRPVLIHSGADALGGGAPTEEQSAAVERALAALARSAREAGARQLLIAGGETSGAVMASLGIASLELGDEVDPGVSWLLGRGGGEPVNLMLKSGNFGSEELFTNAWEAL